MGAQGTGAPPCALAHHVKYVGRGTDHNIQAPALLTVNDPVCASRLHATVDRGVELELLLNSQATFDLMHSYLKDCAGCNPKMMLSTASRGKVTTRRRRASKVRM